ncbi:hypothetical protein ES288_A05G369900v1 [Gossypium darwinii]|uniref:Uncharacterized protein n=1 Tax=Gossypium darwinii TaxID=34276 RepID=A0A5D2GNU3_GOSDA|nr:hypothetical protein ES288_A05G369900v1 [Gossypium darwinii]
MRGLELLFKTFLSPFSISNAAPFLSRKSQPWKQISRVSFASSRTTIVLVINSMQTVPIFLVEGVRPCLEKFGTEFVGMRTGYRRGVRGL